MARHNAIRDAWASLLKQAGWTVRLEQLVPTATGHKRADLVATGPQGEDIAVDIMVIACPDVLDPPHAHLQASASAKASRYHVFPNCRLPNGALFIPLIMNATVPFLDHYAMQFFLRLYQCAGQRRDPGAPAFWHPSLHEFRRAAAARFTVAAARCLYRMHSACGEMPPF